MIPLLRKTLLLFVIGIVSSTPKVKNEKERILNTAPLFQQEYVSKPLKILAVLPFGSYSHHVMPETLMLELARRGHHVTMVSPNPPKESVPNYNHIDISDVLPKTSGTFTFDSLTRDQDSQDVEHMISRIAQHDGHETCRKIYNHTKVKPLLQPPHKFDIFFSEVFGSGCCFAIGTKLQVPSIAMVTNYAIVWVEDYNGETFNPSYIENPYRKTTSQGLSSFVERLKNTFYYLRTRMAAHNIFTRPSEIAVREFLGADSPSLQEIRNNISLFMSNTHPGIFTAAKPLVPRILPVSGLHLRPPNFNKLPADIKTWLDNAPNGVVLFSMGSLIHVHTFPEYLFKAFADAFKELKHLRFIWKLESTLEPAKAATIPDNVLVVKWVPQMEVLSHSNTKTFITHGGLMSTTESIYAGVPMIGIPVFAEQPLNIQSYEKLGIALQLDYRTLTKEQLVLAITKATSDHSFRQRITEVSRLFKDRPMSPLDSAIWWTEYIVRNKGAPHLASPVATMPFWKLALLDVVAVVLGCISFVFLIVYLVIKRCLLRNMKPLQVEQQKKKEN